MIVGMDTLFVVVSDIREGIELSSVTPCLTSFFSKVWRRDADAVLKYNGKVRTRGDELRGSSWGARCPMRTIEHEMLFSYYSPIILPKNPLIQMTITNTRSHQDIFT